MAVGGNQLREISGARGGACCQRKGEGVVGCVENWRG